MRNLEEFHFRCIERELTERDVTSPVHVFGYTPHMIVTGTYAVTINNKIFQPGEQWLELVPNSFPIDIDYDIFFSGVETGDVKANPSIKSGKLVKLTYYQKVRGTC